MDQRTNETKPTVTVLGVGRMGRALADALIAAGFAVTVWNRTRAKCEPLVARGARAAATADEAIAASAVVIGNVSDYEASAAIVRTPRATSALRGRLFVELATGTPARARDAAAYARDHGFRYLDGAIMATPDLVATDGCTILYSGPKRDFDASGAIFAALGRNAVYVGDDTGLANALDASILVVLWGALLGTFHGVAIAEAERLPLEVFAGTLAATMPVLTGVLATTVTRIAARRFGADATTFSSVATCDASVRIIGEMARAHGTDAGLPSALEHVFGRTVREGRADDDVAAVYLALSPAGAEGRDGAEVA